MKRFKQQGFTLIELVVVIIILGILAVTAAPKFINLQSDARESTLDGVKAALQTADQLLYSKAAIAGVETEQNQDVDISDTVSVNTEYGYLRISNVANTQLNVEKVLDMTFQTLSNNNTVVEDEDWGFRRHDNTSFSIVPRGKTANTDCRFVYTEAIDSGSGITLPQYNVVDTDC